MSGPLTLPPSAGVAKRFWSKVDKRAPDECWPWLAYRSPQGYGRFGIDYSILLAHRVAWWLTYGAIPEGVCVLHHCDNPAV